MNKISDFKISECILKALCQSNKLSFVDVCLDFDEKSTNTYCLRIGPSKNISHTLYKIINEYIRNSFKILDMQLLSNSTEKKNFLISIATMLRDIIYKENSVFDPLDEFSVQYLYQKPLVWLLMKNIICPINKINLKNIRIITGINPYVDIAKYYSEEEAQANVDINYEFIFINEIDNNIVQNAFIFIEAIRSYGLSPIDVIKDIFESDIYMKFEGLLRLAFDTQESVELFNFVLSTILGVDLISFKFANNSNSVLNKYAQSQAYSDKASQWWYLGLIEGMLQPVRGADWSTYETLEPYVKEFWDKVESIKQQKAKDGNPGGVPFDQLLRLKSTQTVGYKVDPTRSIQDLLSSDRVW